MFFALALALIAGASGALVTYLFDEDAPLVARLCMGAPIGLAALGFFTFILASYLGLTPPTLAFGAALVASPFALLISPIRRAHLRVDLLDTSRGARRALIHPSLKATVQFFFYLT